MTLTETETATHRPLPKSKTLDRQKRPHKKTKMTWPTLRLELHDRIMEGLTTHQLAVHFEVSERTVGGWKKTLARELFANEDFDSLEWVSEQIASLKLLRTEAMQNYDLAKERGAKLQARKWFSLVLKAEIGLNDLLVSSGALDEKPMSPANLKKLAQRKDGDTG